MVVIHVHLHPSCYYKISKYTSLNDSMSAAIRTQNKVDIMQIDLGSIDVKQLFTLLLYSSTKLPSASLKRLSGLTLQFMA